MFAFLHTQTHLVHAASAFGSSPIHTKIHLFQVAVTFGSIKTQTHLIQTAVAFEDTETPSSGSSKFPLGSIKTPSSGSSCCYSYPDTLRSGSG